jgi:major membrane immunogen (membrane-anchored lipoprotein)
MKKLITALLTLSLVLLVGCGSDETDETTTNDPDPTADKTDTDKE